MRAVFFDGHRDCRVPLPSWVSVHAASDVLLIATCSRCKGSERIDIHCGSAERKLDAERALGRFARWHQRCEPRVRVKRPGRLSSSSWTSAWRPKGEP